MKWSDKALAAVRAIALAKPTFFSDDVWNLLGRDRDIELRNLGAVMKLAKRKGWCSVTADYRRVSGSHRHLRPVWLSNICEVTE
jgi:hypothetical protein